MCPTASYVSDLGAFEQPGRDAWPRAARTPGGTPHASPSTGSSADPRAHDLFPNGGILTLTAHRRRTVTMVDAMSTPSQRLTDLPALLEAMNEDEVARAWARCMRELRRRDLIRTANTPVGDYAERICCQRFGLTRMGFSEKSIDAVDADGVQYQIKARRLTRENPSRQLGAIRDVDKHPFDILLAVFFNEDLELQEIWSVPHTVVSKAKYVARTNSTRFVLTPTVQKDPRVRQLV